MTSIHVSLKGTAAAGAGAIASAGGSRSDLEALQKKLTGLIKQLKDASQDTSAGGKERLKLLELAIRACQMQIEQLTNAEAQKAAKKAEEAAQSGAARDDRRTTGAIGAQIDTHA
jgi:hypothetical protein